MLPTRRQKAVLQAIQDHLAETGQTPTLLEIARRCGLSSVATVHRHLALLQERGLVRRRRSRRRGVELKAAAQAGLAVPVPLLGRFATGRPITGSEDETTVAVPREMVRRPAEAFAVRVHGSGLDADQILDGDLLVAERRDRPNPGNLVLAIQEDGSAWLRTCEDDRGRVRGRVQGVVTGLLRRYE
jgi:repressor LexA